MSTSSNAGMGICYRGPSTLSFYVLVHHTATRARPIKCQTAIMSWKESGLNFFKSCLMPEDSSWNTPWYRPFKHLKGELVIHGQPGNIGRLLPFLEILLKVFPSWTRSLSPKSILTSPSFPMDPWSIASLFAIR